MSGRLSLRAVTPADREVIFEVYASTRAEEVAATGWEPAVQQAFLAQQFAAQDAAWHARLPDAAYDLVLVDDEPAGRLYVERRADAIHVVDISLLPQWRGRGIGGRLLEAVAAEADERGVTLSVYVERHNPAIRLYERLGLVAVGADAVYLLMQRPARGDGEAATQPKTA